MASEHQASRTLVKSPPELWTECSDAASLARHLGELGEIRITRLEPEKAVAWEGAQASGTVQIEPAGWGTRVTLTARVRGAPAPEVDEPPPAEEGDDDAQAETEAAAPDADAGSEEEPHGASDGAAAGGLGWRRLIVRARAWFSRSGAGGDPPPGESSEGGLAARAAPPSPRSVPGAEPASAEAHHRTASVEPDGAVGAAVPALPGRTTPIPALSVSALTPGPTGAREASGPSGARETSGPSGARETSGPSGATQVSGPSGATPTPDLGAVLAAALESLGRAHHRPFSRA